MEQLYRTKIVDKEICPEGMCELIPDSELVEPNLPQNKLQRMGEVFLKQIDEKRRNRKELKEEQRKMWARMAVD